MRKIAILMVAVIVTASTQCIAACGVLPCAEVPQQHSSVPASEDCHHKAPPADHDHTQTNCGHPQLVSEAGPQAASVSPDSVTVALIELNFVEFAPETPVPVDFSSDRSPPSLIDLTASTILRV